MSKAKQKGTRFETQVLPWIQAIWPDAIRTGSAYLEKGDYLNTGDFAIEAKNHKDMRLAAWVRQAELTRRRMGKLFSVVIHKRRMFGAHGAYVTMPLEQWVNMLLYYTGNGMIDRELEPLSEDDIPDWFTDEKMALSSTDHKLMRLREIEGSSANNFQGGTGNPSRGEGQSPEPPANGQEPKAPPPTEPEGPEWT